MERCDLLLTGALLPDGRREMAVAMAGGRIAAILAPGEARPAAVATRDLGGQLLLPSLTDGHMHLDKTLFGLPWWPHQAAPNRPSRIETDQRVLPALPLGVADRAGALLRRCVASGTAHVRTHVDITPSFGLAALEGVLAAKAAFADQVTVQTVAFPQAGVMRAPGTLGLMEEALRSGADLVGGIDPCEVDRDPKGQLDAIFALAEKHARAIDIHLHEPGEMGLFSLTEIAARVRAQGMQGRVTISHGFCLGMLAESKQRAMAETMGELGISLVSHGAGGAALPPLMLLREHGVRVFCGNDDIRDTWSPYGTGDMLERASVVGWRLDVRTDPLLEAVFGMCGEAGARALGLEPPALAVGAPAHLFSLAAGCIAEAVGQHPPRGVVVFGGRVVAG